MIKECNSWNIKNFQVKKMDELNKMHPQIKWNCKLTIHVLDPKPLDHGYISNTSLTCLGYILNFWIFNTSVW